MRVSYRRRERLRRLQPAALLAILLLAISGLYLFPLGSIVWATPQQNRLRQTIPTRPAPAWAWIGDAEDYAPSGMPDFDQKQADWHSDSSLHWTYCGPVAVANALWCLDSDSEPMPVSPPTVHDAYPLVQSYGGNAWDDHAPENVIPLVDDLAARLGTQKDGEHPGTEISAAVSALQAYLAARGLQDDHPVALIRGPSFHQLRLWAERGDGVVLLLGFWEDQGDRWVYLGGHYVALAGVEPQNRYLAISDPFRDAFEAGEITLGRSRPPGHPFPHDTDLHNDAQYVSHDAYFAPLERPAALADVEILQGYVPAEADVSNFEGQNVPVALESHLGIWQASQIYTAIDYAILIPGARSRYTVLLPVILKGAR